MLVFSVKEGLSCYCCVHQHVPVKLFNVTLSLCWVVSVLERTRSLFPFIVVTLTHNLQQRKTFQLFFITNFSCFSLQWFKAFVSAMHMMREFISYLYRQKTVYSLNTTNKQRKSRLFIVYIQFFWLIFLRYFGGSAHFIIWKIRGLI